MQDLNEDLNLLYMEKKKNKKEKKKEEEDQHEYSKRI